MIKLCYCRANRGMMAASFIARAFNSVVAAACGIFYSGGPSVRRIVVLGGGANNVRVRPQVDPSRAVHTCNARAYGAHLHPRTDRAPVGRKRRD